VGPDAGGGPALEQIMAIRWRKCLSGAVVGSSLGVAGVLLQGLLRNPLASPDIMGLASGAGLAVMITIFAARASGSSVLAGIDPMPPALVGAFGALVVVYLLAQRGGLIDPVSMVLVGIIVSITAAAGTMLIQHLMPEQLLISGRWLLGGIDDEVTAGRIVVAGGLCGVVLGASIAASRVLDAAMMSADEARSVGVRLGLVRAWQFGGAGVLTGAAVALAGPIGFIGLVAPHLARGLLGPRHAWTLPGAAALGAVLVVGADATIRAIDLRSGRLPLGVLTALLGGPIFLGMLLEQKRRGVYLR
jgi:iron complex transport system permease protein